MIDPETKEQFEARMCHEALGEILRDRRSLPLPQTFSPLRVAFRGQTKIRKENWLDKIRRFFREKNADTVLHA